MSPSSQAYRIARTFRDDYIDGGKVYGGDAARLAVAAFKLAADLSKQERIERDAEPPEGAWPLLLEWQGVWVREAVMAQHLREIKEALRQELGRGDLLETLIKKRKEYNALMGVCPELYDSLRKTGCGNPDSWVEGVEI